VERASIAVVLVGEGEMVVMHIEVLYGAPWWRNWCG